MSTRDSKKSFSWYFYHKKSLELNQEDGLDLLWNIWARRRRCFCPFKDDEYFHVDDGDSAVTGLHFKERKIILVIFTKKGCCWWGLNHNCFVTSKLNRGMTTRVFILTKSVPSLCRVHKSGSIIQMFCLAQQAPPRNSYSAELQPAGAILHFPIF